MSRNSYDCDICLSKETFAYEYCVRALTKHVSTFFERIVFVRYRAHSLLSITHVRNLNGKAPLERVTGSVQLRLYRLVNYMCATISHICNMCLPYNQTGLHHRWYLNGVWSGGYIFNSNPAWTIFWKLNFIKKQRMMFGQGIMMHINKLVVHVFIWTQFKLLTAVLAWRHWQTLGQDVVSDFKFDPMTWGPSEYQDQAIAR